HDAPFPERRRVPHDPEREAVRLRGAPGRGRGADRPLRRADVAARPSPCYALPVERAPDSIRWGRVQGVRVPTFVYGTAWKEDATARLTRLALDAGFRGI